MADNAWAAVMSPDQLAKDVMVFLQAWTQGVDLCDQVVRRMRYPDAAPEAWAMENPRRGGPPLYAIRWHTGFFGSFSSGYVVFSIV